MTHRVSLRIGDEELVLETGRMAKQANGAVFARSADRRSSPPPAAPSSRGRRTSTSCRSRSTTSRSTTPRERSPAASSSARAGPRTRRSSSPGSSTGRMRPLFSKTFKREIQVMPIVDLHRPGQHARHHRHERRLGRGHHLRHPVRGARSARCAWRGWTGSSSSTPPSTR